MEILHEEVLGKPRISQDIGHRKVYAAALIDEAIEKVVPLLGAHRLSDELGLPLDDGNDGLDGEHLPREGRNCGNTAALAQKLEGIEHREKLDLILLFIQLGCDLGGRELPFPNEPKRIVHEDAFAETGVHTVYDIHLAREFLCRAHRAGVCTRKFGGQGDGDHLAPVRRQRGKRLFKAIIADLAGLRDLVRLDEFFKKLPM